MPSTAPPFACPECGLRFAQRGKCSYCESVFLVNINDPETRARLRHSDAKRIADKTLHQISFIALPLSATIAALVAYNIPVARAVLIRLPLKLGFPGLILILALSITLALRRLFPAVPLFADLEAPEPLEEKPGPQG